MKIVFAADGSKCTRKALAYLVTHEGLSGPDAEVVVVNVQTPLPPRVRSAVGAEIAQGYLHDESEKVLAPIRRFLDRHGVSYRCEVLQGQPAEQILRSAKKAKAHLIVMGSHGHGPIGRAILGSVAQKVLTDADLPVLLVK